MSAPIHLSHAAANQAQSNKPLQTVSEGKAQDFASKMLDADKVSDQANKTYVNHQTENHKKQKHHNIQNQHRHHAGSQVQADGNDQIMQKQNHTGNEGLKKLNHNTKKATAKHNQAMKNSQKTAKSLKSSKSGATDGEADVKDDNKKDSNSNGGGQQGSGGQAGGDGSKGKKKKQQKSGPGLKETIDDKAKRKKKTVSHKGKKFTIKKSKNRMDAKKSKFDNVFNEEQNLQDENEKINSQARIEKLQKEKRKKRRRKRVAINDLIDPLMEGLVTRATLLHDEGEKYSEMQMHLTGPLIENTKLIIKQKGKILDVTIYASSYSAYVYFERHLPSLKRTMNEGKHDAVTIKLLYVKDIPTLDEDAEILDLTELATKKKKKKAKGEEPKPEAKAVNS